MVTSFHSQTDTYTFGDFTVHLATREVFRAGEELAVAPKLFELLTALIAHRQRVVHRWELMRWLWPEAVVSKGALPQAVLKLRAVLSGNEKSEQWISTVRGVGYRFVGEVTTTSGSAAGDARRERPWEPSESPQKTQVRHRVDTLHRRACEQTLRLDFEGLRQSVELLRQREHCGSDPRARVFALVHENILDRHGGNLEKAWQGLELAQQIASELPYSELTVSLLRAKGRFFLHYDASGDAIATLREAFEAAKQTANRLDVADCASLLAAGFAKVGDAESFGEWSDAAVRLSKESDLDWYVLHCLVSMASFWIGLGETARSAGQALAAMRYWGRAEQLLDEAEASPGWTSHAKVVSLAKLNRALVSGYLHPERRKASIHHFREELERETVPQLQLGILLALAIFYRDDGNLEAARSSCEGGLENIRSNGVFNVKSRFLDLAADVSSRQGRHIDAVRHLRELLNWNDQSARAGSLQVAKVTALRLKTERALAAAEAERELARRYQLENEFLQQRLRLRDIEAGQDTVSGYMEASAFRTWLGQQLLRSRHDHLSLTVVVFTFNGLPQGGCASAVGHDLTTEAAKTVESCIAAHVRHLDRWTLLCDNVVVLVFGAQDLDRIDLAAGRLRKALCTALFAHGFTGHTATFRTIDTAHHPELGTLWNALVEATETTKEFASGQDPGHRP